MPVVKTFQVLPDRGVQLDVILNTSQVVLQFHGTSSLPCWCGDSHQYKIKTEVRTTRGLRGQELADIEQVIRGVDAAAQRLAWRILILEVSKHSPCLTMSASDADVTPSVDHP